MGAEGGTGPSSPFLADASESVLESRVTAPYPRPPAMANMARFWRIAEEEDEDEGLGLPFPLLEADAKGRQFAIVDGRVMLGYMPKGRDAGRRADVSTWHLCLPVSRR